MDLTQNAPLWEYLSSHQKDLYTTGKYLEDHFVTIQEVQCSDYSFLVFPFAKMYEGFLKQLFLDIDYISEEEYESDFLRLGKLLSPNQPTINGIHSLYTRVRNEVSNDLAKNMWVTWKKGRNELFHYFPHNYRQATLIEAKETIDHITITIDQAYRQLFTKCKIRKSTKYL